MAWPQRPLKLALVAFSITAGLTRAAEDPAPIEPQHARVIIPGAAVRSGPSDTYYLTDSLPQNTAVEVYRQQPDGWCAIRPPADSFSWVYAPHLQVLDDDVAEINKDEVASRVGSRLSEQRDVVQIRLQKGERVRIIDNDDRDNSGWYKIAPPAGEFRWMHARDLAIDGKVPVEVPEGDVVTPVSHQEPANDPSDASDGKWTAATTAIPDAGNTPASKVNVDSPNGASRKYGQDDITPVGTPTPTSEELAMQLNELELRLSRMVAEPMTTWSIESLEQAAETLLSQADTVAERDAVKNTLTKIDRFAAIQRRAAVVRGQSSARNRVVGAVPDAAHQIQDTATTVQPEPGATQSPYDAVGVLRPVVSQRPGAPQFALVNEQGQVVTFVTPTPGVNLQPYLGRKIGITGSRGYIPEFRRPHVTAGRVAPVNDRLLR